MGAEAKLRAAAAALLEAWADAHAAGYRMVWPAQPAGLAFLAISETGAVATPPQEKPAQRTRTKQFPAD